MIKSMTGFASLACDHDTTGVTVTVRSVNHRYLDLQVRLQPRYGDLEPRLRTAIQEHVSRGRVDLTVTLQPKKATDVSVEVNETLIAAVADAFDQARRRGLVEGSLTPGDLLRVPEVLTVRDRVAEVGSTPQPLAEAVLEATRAALRALDQMRIHEGGFLHTDLEQRRSDMEDLLGRIAAAAEAGRVGLEKRLLERAQELTRDVPADAAALAQEVVRVALRSDISEEIVRIRGHLAHWQTLTDVPEPCGRKLDFLLQEMNREVNTIGAKVEGTLASELVVQAKAELEKMREQVQNVE